MTETTILTGGCLCGAVRYRAEASATLPYVCWCADCRRWGGGPAHWAIVVAAREVAIEGAPRVHVVTAESGREVARYFCGACGGHLFTSPWPEVSRYSLKAGTLDDPALYETAHEIWARSRAPWADRNPEAERHEAGFPGPVAIG